MFGGKLKLKLHPPSTLEETQLTEDEQPVYEEIGKILKNFQPQQGKPSEILPYLYLGALADAQNKEKLKELGINYVINMAGGETATGPFFYGKGVNYLEFEAQDMAGYDLFQHYDDVEKFIDAAKASESRCLIHCLAGINRSATLLIAYLVRREGMSVLGAVAHTKKTRGYVLSNFNFRKQLVKFLASRGLLR